MDKIKIYAFLTAILTIASCTACGNSNDSSDNSISNNSLSDSSTDNSNDTISDSDTNESSAEDNGIAWKLKDVAVPEFKTEIIEVEGNRTEPVTKIKSFMNIDANAMDEYLKSSDFYKNFEMKRSTQEVAETKSYSDEYIFDETLNKDAVGYTVYNNFSGGKKTNDGLISGLTDIEIRHDTGELEGLGSFSISFDCNIKDVDEFMQNSYDLFCQAMPVEIVDYIFFGGTDLEEFEDKIECSNGITVNISRSVDIEDGQYRLGIWLSHDIDNCVTVNSIGDYVPVEMEYSFEDLIPGSVGNVDIHDSYNFADGLYIPFPVYGTEFDMSSLDSYSKIREQSIDGKTIENSYQFKTTGYRKEVEDSETFINAFSPPEANCEASITTVDGKITEYTLNLNMTYYTLFTEGTAETNDYTVQCVLDSLKEACPDATPEFRTFEQLDNSDEDYVYKFTTNFNGLTVPGTVVMSATNIGSSVTADLYLEYKSEE